MVRFKSRWMLVEFQSDEDKWRTIDGKIILRALKDSIQMNFGEFGIGSTGSLSVRYFNPTTRLAIVKCHAEQAPTVRASITLLHTISVPTTREELIICPRVLHMSGTVKKLQLEAIKYDSEMMLTEVT